MNPLEFEMVYSWVGESLLGYKKTFNIYKEIYEIRDLKGNTAEIGVFKGATSKFIHFLLRNRIHYAYDTYKGVARSDSIVDVHKDGEFNCSLEYVMKNIDMDKVIYKVGCFPDTFDEEYEQFAFVHSDTDTYYGTLKTLEVFTPHMVKGGKIVFDDYEWRDCPGVKKAIQEYLEKNPNIYSVKVYDNSYFSEKDDTSINQCVLTKL